MLLSLNQDHRAPQTRVAASRTGLHILISVNAAWNIWNFRRPLVEALLAEGHRVTILAPVDDKVAALEGIGCRFVPLDMDAKGINPFGQLALQRRLSRLFEAEAPDIILSYTIKNNISGAFAARKLAIPFLPNLTGLGTAFLSGGVMRRVAEFLYARAFRDLPVVFFQNRDDKALFVKRGLVSSHQGRVLPGSGIDLRHFNAMPLPETDTGPVFLMIARLIRDKGVHEYVDAAREIKKHTPNARFQLLGAVGSSNRGAIDEALVAQWEAEGTIEYLGTVEDVRTPIAQAHCVVLPSYLEGAPRTLIEAAAMARPLIATDVPGCRAVVEDGKNGFLCAPRSGESLAQAIQKFLSMPAAEQADMGRFGRLLMEQKFDEAIVTDAYREAITELTAIAPYDMPIIEPSPEPSVQTSPANATAPTPKTATP
ncbi:MAG: glycosyltransferase family 4 protein [Maritimibacter sp.]